VQTRLNSFLKYLNKVTGGMQSVEGSHLQPLGTLRKAAIDQTQPSCKPGKYTCIEDSSSSSVYMKFNGQAKQSPPPQGQILQSSGLF
jgi:hypothetical protein